MSDERPVDPTVSIAEVSSSQKPEKEDWTDEDAAPDILSVGGMLLLAANDKEIPQGVVAAASGLVGLLTGIFATKSSQA